MSGLPPSFVLFGSFLCLVVPYSASSGRTEKAVMVRVVPGNSTDNRTLDAAFCMGSSTTYETTDDDRGH